MSEQSGDVRIKLSSGETYIAATQRPDGTWRKPRKVKSGYIPQEEQPKFESRAQQMTRQSNSALKFPVGFCPSEMQKKQQLTVAAKTLLNSSLQKPVTAIYKPNASITPQDHIQKKINLLRKKLNEIENLKEKVNNGEIIKLEQTQLQKIERKSNIESEIDKLIKELEEL